MKTLVSNYLQDISKKFSRETSTEYSYRTEFEQFLREAFHLMGVVSIDHDAKSVDGNKPDFAIIKNQIPILYIETKDIGISLDSVENSDQMSRYFGYSNLVLTDYLEFRFYRDGLRYGEAIKIADFDKKTRSIITHEERYELLVRTLLDFTKSNKEPVRSGGHLAKIMGGKARRIRDNIRDYLKDESEETSATLKVYRSIKKLLVHDLDINSFSDMYAQTIVYGLFVARFYDESPENFTRQEARDLIPNSNPFLRHFFDHIVGPDFDKRLEFIVDELCEVFSHSDVEKLTSDFYNKSSKSKMSHDPVIHFYEDFLKEYDQELRKRMGAYYTPTPVVRFMTRSVDFLLKKSFGLKDGLSDTTKTADGKTHKVQVLDPAVGTGTFISGVIREIYKNFVGQQGSWPKYVHNDLLPRIHGFELMMAPYTIAHLKMGMSFKETGFKHFNRRLGIYLTNSLEKAEQQVELFNSFGLADSIAQESKEAEVIKNSTPIMVVIGNPPYSGESSNAFYTENDVYKFEADGRKLQERNPKWINDDYVKFFRFAESMVERTKEGIVCMITAHGYIDNPTFRGMRWHLMNTFSSIYVLDLHGNSNKREFNPAGGVDENVFNIKTGVSIFFGVKKPSDRKTLADVYLIDLFGKREQKFDLLEKNNINTLKWTKLKPISPNYSWTIQNEETRSQYNNGIDLSCLFRISSVGIVTSRDRFVIDRNKATLSTRIQTFLNSESVDMARASFGLSENKSWTITKALKHQFDESNIRKISYRPFDIRFVYYHDDFIERSRREVMNNIEDSDLSLVVLRQVKAGKSYQHVFVAQGLVESTYVSNKTSEIGYVMPLYLTTEGKKIHNFDMDMLNKIKEQIGEFEEQSLFDYIYAVLYSEKYRTQYAEFLRVDFPKVPLPMDKNQFENLAKLGHRLRNLHLMSDSSLDSLITTFPEIGSDTIGNVSRNEKGDVFINEKQYFGGVPESAWDFSIGGYQPAQKWLKDRKGTALNNEDIKQYQRMVVSLVETQKVMKKIDDLIVV